MPNSENPGGWPIERSAVLEKYSISTVLRDLVRSPRTGRVHEFTRVESADASAVLAITARDELVLVRQFRHGTREIAMELPDGFPEGDGLLTAAARELREETG